MCCGYMKHCLNLKNNDGISAQYGIVYEKIGQGKIREIIECAYESGSCNLGSGIEDFNTNITVKTKEEFEDLKTKWK